MWRTIPPSEYLTNTIRAMTHAAHDSRASMFIEERKGSDLHDILTTSWAQGFEASGANTRRERVQQSEDGSSPFSF